VRHLKNSGWRIGSGLAFVEAGLFLVLLGVSLAYRANWIGHLLALALLGFYALGSVLILWRIIKRRPGEPRQPLGQLAAMPRRVKRWVLGDSDRS
jgi:hypothetical protein